MTDAGPDTPEEIDEVIGRLKRRQALDLATSWARPVACWVAVLAVIVNTIVLPLAQLWGVTIASIDAAAMAVLVGPIIAYIAARSVDKALGTATSLEPAP